MTKTGYFSVTTTIGDHTMSESTPRTFAGMGARAKEEWWHSFSA